MAALGVLCAVGDSVAAQKSAEPCSTPPGTVLVETGTGIHPTVTGIFPGLYGPEGERASEQFQRSRGTAANRFHSVVQLTSISGSYAAPRRVEIGENERFDLGDLRPGHYIIRVDFSFRGPVVGEFDVRRMPVMLCLSLPVNPWVSDSVGSPARAKPGVHPAGPTRADSVAVGDAIGRYYGSRPTGPQQPFAILGPESPLTEAARHGFMVAEGDTVPPGSVRAAIGPWSTLSVDRVELAGSDSVLVTMTFAACRPRSPAVNSGVETRTYVLVRGRDPTTWVVTSSVGPVTSTDGHCT